MDVVPIGVTLNRKITHPCSICQNPQKKNGKRNGKQRWRCINCNASTTHYRPDVTARNQLSSFITWLMGKLTQAEHGGGTGRTFRHQTQWCWKVPPYLQHPGEVFDEIQVDGLYLRKGWCLLIAIANGKVISWQWCDHEKAAAWTALLQHVPEPKVIITDGGSGLMKALKPLWPEVKIQRCLVHIQRNVRTHLTMNPRLAAGKSLRRLGLQLTRIRTREAAAAWMTAFAAWHTEHQELLNERTYAAQWAGPRPTWQRKARSWWYTHERLRKAYESMNRALQRGHLFTYLDQNLEGLGINATTNMIEGAINSGIREMIRDHRGMPIEHRRRACEWFCWTHSQKSSRPSLPAMIKAAKALEQEQSEALQEAAEPLIGPELYGTVAVAEEGLYSRAGWAGRSR